MGRNECYSSCYSSSNCNRCCSLSMKIVDAGNRGVLLHWNAVDLSAPPLDEGIHFLVPFQDDIVQMKFVL